VSPKIDVLVKIYGDTVQSRSWRYRLVGKMQFARKFSASLSALGQWSSFFALKAINPRMYT
jgi:hypothetical protein